MNDRCWSRAARPGRARRDRSDCRGSGAFGRAARPRAVARMAGSGARLPDPGAARACARKRRRPRSTRRVRLPLWRHFRQSPASRKSMSWPRNTPTSTCAFSTGRRRANPSGSTRTGLQQQAPMFDVKAWYKRHNLVSQDWAKRPDDHLVVELRFLAYLFAQARAPRGLGRSGALSRRSSFALGRAVRAPRGRRNAAALLCRGGATDPRLP